MKLWATLGLAWFGLTGSGAGAESLDGFVQPGSDRKQYIVAFVAGVSPEEQRALFEKIGLEVDEYVDYADVVLAHPQTGTVHASAEDHLRSHPKVRYIEEDFYTNWLQAVSPAGFAETNFVTGENSAVLGEIGDRARRLQSTIGNSNSNPAAAAVPSNVPWGVARVDAPAAWGKTQGQNVRVAVIDTGIDCTHPDLSCSLSEGINYVNPGQPPMDDQGHGTHVSGTIAAKMTAKYIGVAPQARVIPVKVLDAAGGGRLSTVCKGIRWAARENIPIASMSLGSPKGSKAMVEAINFAVNKKMVLIAAAGNGGLQNQPVAYPGAYPGVIAVAASGLDPQTNRDFLAPFSSRGSQVAFIAPGVDIWSTAPGGQYAMHSGTSMATPHVSGLAALAYTQGAKGPAGIRAALSRAATTLPGLFDTEEGRGMVDAAKLLKK